MKKEIVELANINCGSCAAKIKNNLAEVVGMKSVEVNIYNGEVILEFEDILSIDELLENLEVLGYPEK